MIFVAEVAAICGYLPGDTACFLYHFVPILHHYIEIQLNIQYIQVGALASSFIAKRRIINQS